MGERSKTASPLYVFVIVDQRAEPVPHTTFYWTRAEARDRIKAYPPSWAVNYRVRRAKLTVFNK